MITKILFAACNDTHCPRKAFCHRQSFTVKLKNSVAWIDNYKCRANWYQDFVPISREDLGLLPDEAIRRFNRGAEI